MTRCWKRSGGRIYTSFERGKEKKKKSKNHLEIFPYEIWPGEKGREEKKKSTLLPFYFRL